MMFEREINGAVFHFPPESWEFSEICNFHALHEIIQETETSATQQPEADL